MDALPPDCILRGVEQLPDGQLQVVGLHPRLEHGVEVDPLLSVELGLGQLTQFAAVFLVQVVREVDVADLTWKV